MLARGFLALRLQLIDDRELCCELAVLPIAAIELPGIEKLIEIMFEYDGPRWLYISSALQSERLFACALDLGARDLFLPQQQFELRVVRDVVVEFGPVDAENIRIRRGTQRPVRGVANPACEPVVAVATRRSACTMRSSSCATTMRAENTSACEPRPPR